MYSPLPHHLLLRFFFPFVPGFKQFGYDAPWSSFLHVSYVWGSLGFSGVQFFKNQIWKNFVPLHLILQWTPVTRVCVRPREVVPGGSTSAEKEQK